MNKKLMNTLSSWLKENRKKSGLSLRALSVEIGGLCSDAYLSKLENDKYKNKKGHPPQPDINIIDALALVFKRPIDEARLAAGYSSENKLNEIPSQILLVKWGELSERQIASIVNYIKFQQYDNETITFGSPSSKRSTAKNSKATQKGNCSPESETAKCRLEQERQK